MMEWLNRLWLWFTNGIPRVLPVAGILIAGIVVSWIARRVVIWAVRKSGIEAAAERAGVARILYAVGIRTGLATVLGSLVWICGLVFTISAVAESVGLRLLAEGVAALIAFVPRLLAAVAIVIGGMLLAEILKRLANGVLRSGGDNDPNLMANIIYYAVITLAAVMAVSQIGFDTSLINALLIVGVGGVLLAVGLAFGLGGKAIFANILARQYVEPLVRVGDRITVGTVSGVVLRYSKIGLLLRSDDGQDCLIPGQLLLEQALPIKRDAQIPEVSKL